MFRRYYNTALFAAALCAVAAAPALAQATAFVPLSLEGLTKESLQQIRNYAFPSGYVTLGGVPFYTLPYPYLNTWDGDSPNGDTAVTTLTLPVNVANVLGVHTLINTIWGQGSPSYASLTFNFGDGTHFVKSLYGNVDIRDSQSLNSPSVYRVGSDFDKPFAQSRKAAHLGL